MSFSDAAEQAILDLLFINSNFANFGDATGLRGSSTAGSLYFSLHTADPADAGSQTTSEAAYTGYARVGVARSGAGFTRTGSSVSPNATVAFGTWTAGATTVLTHGGIGLASAGAGVLLMKGALSASITPGAGVTPQILAGTAFTLD